MFFIFIVIMIQVYTLTIIVQGIDELRYIQPAKFKATNNIQFEFLKCFREGSLTFKGGWGIGQKPNIYSDLNKTLRLYKQHLVVLI